jgi:peptidoglycan/LPS O-acetylase OafA/YrhL
MNHRTCDCGTSKDLRNENEMLISKEISRIEPNESLFLDFVRLSSAQLVFWGHLSSFLVEDAAFIGKRFPIQNLGVVIFFMLSGYLICKTLPKYKNFSDFFIDRFSRIYTTLIPCLLLIAGMDFLSVYSGNFKHSNAFNLQTFIGNILMLQDYPAIWITGHLLHTGPLLTSFGSARPLWTLAVEWWLYMFVGWCYLTEHRNKLLFVLLAVVPLTFSTIGRGQGLSLFWALGAAMIFIPKLGALPQVNNVGWVLGFLLMYFLRIAFAGDFYDTQANLFLAAIFGLLIIRSKESSIFVAFRPILKKTIRVLAGASFALYILHYTAIELLISYQFDKASIAIYSFAISNGLAVAVYFVFDRHHKKIGGLLKKNRRS